MTFALKSGLSESWIKCLRIAIFINQITARLLNPEIRKKFSNNFPQLAQYSRKTELTPIYIYYF
ncbi:MULTISPECIES: hypothetical protein [Crocosphaera]|uniref:Uncharacterized protein n=1 Tax=Crocosphaera watsonii WH 8502 TaxID=423474 RepID=T2IGA3_CROWT|nr:MULTISPECIES: hypothetical protein [Crocosphaera]NQZ62529.1 hypothetical protein [Crocosphaera sp.]CCQ51904.1 hypothetical protein CWATWH8502_1890 [Crocosphaera watsonii WH 8502]